jgi:SPP1 family predicted phage head-tail adaptor
MRLNDKTSNPGELRTVVVLESSALVADAGGAQKAVYTPVATVWAKWINAHGPETVASGAVQAARRATVTIRYRADIDASWAIRKNGERYQLLAPPDDIHERHEYLEMQVQMMQASV